MKNKLLFIFICIFGLSGCFFYYQVDCPDFNEDNLSWLPYQADDVVELYSQSKDSTILFSIKSVEITHTTDYETGNKCGNCDDRIEIKQNNSNRFKFAIHISLRKNKISNQTYRVGDTEFMDGNYKYSEKRNFLFEEAEYDVVRVFEKTDSKGTFKKLIIAKEIGIIGIIDIYGNSWGLKTNAEMKRFNELDEPDDSDELDDSDEQRKKIIINNVSGCS